MERRLKIGILLTMSLALWCGEAPAQTREYYDAVVFDLRGHVKSFRERMSKVKSPDEFHAWSDYYSFGADGALQPDSQIHIVDHLPNGYPSTSYEGDAKKPEEERNISYYQYESVNGEKRVGEVEDDYELSTFEYGPNGDCIKVVTSDLLDDKNTCRISYTVEKRDAHGNWTMRTMRMASADGRVFFDRRVMREIDYWDDGVSVGKTSPAALASRPAGATQRRGDGSGSRSAGAEDAVVDTERFEEPDRELTIRDMMYRPLGVIDPPGGDIWALTYVQIVEEIGKRSNWELRPSVGREATVFGNRIGGKRQEKGYNLTYRGEPLFNVDVFPSYTTEWIASYSFSFCRDMAGTKSRRFSFDETAGSAVPRWTRDEAIAFAEQLVGDLREAGLAMSTAKNSGGDIYTVVGADEKTFYKVRIFRKKDRYSAFFMVSLDLYRANSSMNTLKNK